MEIEGRIIHVLPEVSGTSKSSGKPWKKREYVLETHESYPKKVHFDFFGDRADQFPLKEGDEIRLSFDIESHEYQGRWFTSIRGWKAEPATGAPAQQPQYPQQPQYAQPAAPAYQQPLAHDPFAPGAVPPPPAAPAAPSDDLPF